MVKRAQPYHSSVSSRTRHIDCPHPSSTARNRSACRGRKWPAAVELEHCTRSTVSPGTSPKWTRACGPRWVCWASSVASRACSIDRIDRQRICVLFGLRERTRRGRFQLAEVRIIIMQAWWIRTKLSAVIILWPSPWTFPKLSEFSQWPWRGDNRGQSSGFSIGCLWPAGILP